MDPELTHAALMALLKEHAELNRRAEELVRAGEVTNAKYICVIMQTDLEETAMSSPGFYSQFRRFWTLNHLNLSYLINHSSADAGWNHLVDGYFGYHGTWSAMDTCQYDRNLDRTPLDEVERTMV